MGLSLFHETILKNDKQFPVSYNWLGLGDSSQTVEEGGFFSVKPYFSKNKLK